MRATRATHADNDLRDAIAGCFVAFASYPVGPPGGCPHCVSAGDEACIRSVPLRALTPAQIGRYAFKAMTTWGSPDDYKHYLPRILELVALDPAAAGWPGLTPDHVFRKIVDAGWAAWPTHEQAAVERFIAAVWRREIAQSGRVFPHAEWLAAFATVREDLVPYLAEWSRDDSPHATEALAEMIVAYGGDLLASKPRSLFADRPRARAHVRDWLLSRETRDRLLHAFVARGDTSAAKVLADAADLLELYGG